MLYSHFNIEAWSWTYRLKTRPLLKAKPRSDPPQTCSVPHSPKKKRNTGRENKWCLVSLILLTVMMYCRNLSIPQCCPESFSKVVCQFSLSQRDNYSRERERERDLRGESSGTPPSSNQERADNCVKVQLEPCLTFLQNFTWICQVLESSETYRLLIAGIYLPFHVTFVGRSYKNQDSYVLLSRNLICYSELIIGKQSDDCIVIDNYIRYHRN